MGHKPTRSRVLRTTLIVAAVCTALLLSAGLLSRDSVNLGVVLQTAFGIGKSQQLPTGIAAQLTTAPGFEISLYADNVPQARFMRLTNGGDLLVSSPRTGQILLLRDSDGDGLAEPAITLLDNLNLPHGLDLHNGWLYIAEPEAFGRIRFDQATGAVSGDYQRLVTDLPYDGGHYTRTLRVKDDRLYLSIGSSCNVCREKDPRLAAITSYAPDGSDEQLYATGLRNSVGLDWAPWSGELYATDNGRDHLGDNFPPDELNRVQRGQFYGWPYINGNGVPDPDFGDQLPAGLKTRSTDPVHGFRAHNAPLGIRFNRSDKLPETYRRSALVALHGSWNRSEPDGYKLVSLHWDERGDITERDFVTGFLQPGDKVLGRPVDIVQLGNGDWLVSDDYADAIYRVKYVGD